MKRYQAVSTGEQVYTLRERAIVLRYMCICHLHFLRPRSIGIRPKTWKAQEISDSAAATNKEHRL